MPNLDDFVKNIDALLAELKTEVPKIAAQYAEDALALSVVRINKEGAKPGAHYSVEPVYVGKSVFNQKGAFKPIGKGGAARIQAEKAAGKKGNRKATDKLRKDGGERTTMYLPGGYQELRAIQGLPTDVVNLEYSRRMIPNIKLLKVQNKGDYAAAGLVGATNTIEKKKLGGQHKHYGDFLRPTPENVKLLNSEALKKIREITAKLLTP